MSLDLRLGKYFLGHRNTIQAKLGKFDFSLDILKKIDMHLLDAVGEHIQSK